MPEPLEETLTKLVNDIKATGDADEVTTRVKALKTYAEAKKLLDPVPPPEPEPTGTKAFFSRHAGDLIKVGGSLIIVSVIAIVEAKHDVIFRSKATKFI